MGTAVGLAALGLLLNATVWGLSWMPFRGLAEAGMHPLWATAAIYAIASLALGLARPGSVRALLATPVLAWLALASGLTNATFNTAVALGDVVRVVLLFYLMPVWALLLARAMLGEPITARACVRIAVGLAGAALVLHEPGMGWPLPRNLPELLAIAGGVAFALNNVLLRRFAHTDDSARTLAMLAGGVLLGAGVAAVLAFAGASGWPESPGPHGLATLALWAALFLAANMGLQYGAARLPANVTAVVMLSEVLVAGASSWLAGAAELKPQDIAGGLLILAAPWLLPDRSRA
jgi:drug/metabolite transporter (DMT)-like permease